MDRVKTEPPRLKVRRERKIFSLAQTLRKSSHFLVPAGERFVCSRCRKPCSEGRLKAFVVKRCRPIATEATEPSLAIDINAAHVPHLRIHHALLWCGRCGGWSINTPGKKLKSNSLLRGQCKTPSAGGQAALNRLGRKPPCPPLPLKAWPDGTPLPTTPLHKRRRGRQRR